MLNPTVARLHEKITEKGKKIMYVHRDESLVVKTKMILRWRSREKKGKGKLVVVLTVQNAENRKEQVQNIQVQGNRSRDLLFNVIVAHYELSVDEDISREDEGGNSAVNQLHCAVLREEDSHETEDDEQPKSAEEIWHPVSEVILCLAGEDSQRDKDGKGDNEGLQHDSRVVERDEDADGVGLEGGKCR